MTFQDSGLFAALGLPPSGEFNSLPLPDWRENPNVFGEKNAPFRPGGENGFPQQDQFPAVPQRGNVEVRPWRPDLSITERGEVGAVGAANQSNISTDTGGTRSYGILGLNSGSGSALNFARSYPQFGLTARPGTPEFDAQWRRASQGDPKALYDAQVDWHARNVVMPMQRGLVASGVNRSIADDPRVLNYLADRRVQMGDYGWADAMQIAQRARSPEEFIAAVSANDRARIGDYFRSYLGEHPDRVRGLYNRIALRERLALDPNAYGEADFSAPAGGAGPVSHETPKYADLLRSARSAASHEAPATDDELAGRPRSFREKLGETWPARLVSGAVEALRGVVDGNYQPGVRRNDYTDIPAPQAPGPGSTMVGRALGLPPVGWEPNDQYINYAADLAQLLSRGAPIAAPRGAVGVFGGRLAKTADQGALREAEAMAARGEYPSDIFDKTGWFQGADKQWRFEIPDNASRIKSASHLRPNAGADERLGDTFAEGTTHPLGAVLEHRALYDAYPQLRTRPVEMRPAADPNRGAFAPDTGEFQLNASLPVAGARSTALHEAQHGVQTIEGFAPGGNSAIYKAGQKTALNIRDALAWFREVGKTAGASWNERESKLISQYLEAGAPDWVPDASVRKIAASYREHPKALEHAENVVKTYGLDERTSPLPARDMYRRTAGEVEARNVQSRRDMTAEERRGMPPQYTQDVPNDRQIVNPPESRPRWMASSKSVADDVEAFRDKWKAEGVRNFVFDRPNRGEIHLDDVFVPKDNRNAQLGSRFMADLVKLADQHGRTVTLTAARDYGMSLPRLKAFYKRFGFVENKGRNADYAISGNMYRKPKGESQ